MAATIRYSTTFRSYNDTTYRIEIWDKNWNGGSFDFEIGAGGPILSYDTDGDKKFTEIITSKLKVPFVVSDAFDETFINQLRNSYNERDVYIYLFDDTQAKPLWGGQLILDLGDKEDVSYPYVVDLKAIDGLALLKDIDFVIDVTETSPYILSNLYSSQYLQKTTYFLKEILLKAGLPTSVHAPGWQDYEIKTSVNWYNLEHPGTGLSNDPLDMTQVFAGNFYKELENEDSVIVKYEAKSCYDVLKDFCRVWGMRCVFWDNTVYFIQLGEYSNSETGTLANPNNITTRKYDKDGVYISADDNLGIINVLYDLEFEDAIDLGLQKLKGSNYGFYPLIKEVKTNHLLVENQNNFTSFPLPANNGNSPLVNTHYYETTSLGAFTNAKDYDGFFTQIMLKFNNQYGSIENMQMNWTIRARQVGNPTWQKMLDTNSSGNLYWTAFIQPTTSPYPTPTLNFHSQITIPQGISTINIINNEIGGGNIPTDPAFSGNWEFEYYTHTYAGPGGGVVPPSFVGHGGIEANLSGFTIFLPPSGVNINYSNVTNASSVNSSMFCPVVNSVIGYQSQGVSYLSTDNSYVVDLKDLPFGDNEITSFGSMYVYDGSSYIITDFTGKWGVGTTTGNDTITLLLCKEILNHQQKKSFKLNAVAVLSETGKEKVDGGTTMLKRVNPVGRIKDNDGTPFVFLRGDFNLLSDEVDGEWYEFNYLSTSGTSTTTGLGGSNSGAVLGPGTINTTTTAAKIGQPTIPNQIQNVLARTTAYYSVSSSPISRVDVTEMLTSTFKIGDVLELFDVAKQQRYKLTLTADFNIGDTSISFDPLTLNMDINKGSLLILDEVDLGEQYQRKTRGTVGGFDVDETTLSATDITLDSETAEVTALEFIGDLRGAVQFKAKNDSGVTLTKGTPVYIKGISGNTPTVDKADADNAAKMPSFGLVKADANDKATVTVITSGDLINIDTRSYTLGDVLYIDTTAGTLTTTAPAGESAAIQNIGIVEKVHASTGIIKVGGAGRSNATPNLNEGHVFVGDSNNRSISRLITDIPELSVLGKNLFSFRIEGYNITSSNEYVSYGEDNNKSGRFGQANVDAPTQISAQLSLKCGLVYVDEDCKITSGRIAVSGTNAADLTVTLFKATPIDGSSSKISLTKVGDATVSMVGNAAPKLRALGNLLTTTISAGDLLIPSVKTDGESVNFRGSLSFTLKYD